MGNDIATTLRKLLTDNNIRGALVLITERDGMDATISHAGNDIHEVVMIKGLARVIYETKKGAPGALDKVIVNSARTIALACDMIADIGNET